MSGILRWSAIGLARKARRRLRRVVQGLFTATVAGRGMQGASTVTVRDRMEVCYSWNRRAVVPGSDLAMDLSAFNGVNCVYAHGNGHEIHKNHNSY